MKRNTSLSALSTVLMSAVLVSPAHAQSADAKLRSRIENIATLNSIDADDVKPWHLVMTYQVNALGGQPAESGTVEEWWKDKRNWRRVITQGDRKAIEVEADSVPMTGGVAGLDVSTVNLLLAKTIHPVDAYGIADADPVMQPHAFGALKTDCIMLSDPMPVGRGIISKYTLPLGIFPTYCVASDDTLRVMYESGVLSVAMNSVGTFQAHKVGVAIAILGGRDQLGSSKITKLETIEPDGIDLSTADLHKSYGAARIASGVMAGNLIGKVAPSYPQGAKDRHVSGSVVMKAVIGSDGRIRGLHVVSSPDNELSIAALYAVQQWTYKPYVLNGVPTEVDTTITVNFNLSGG